MKLHNMKFIYILYYNLTTTQPNYYSFQIKYTTTALTINPYHQSVSSNNLTSTE